MNARVMPDVRAYKITIRLDAGTLVPHDPGGWVYVWGTASIVGVLDYPEFGTKELRTAEELFAWDSMDSLRGCPLTIHHPDPNVDEGLVTTRTMTSLVHGWVLDVTSRDDELRVRVCLASDEAIAAVASGILELSLGYRSTYVEDPGEVLTADGPKPYTGRQTKIRYNHLALVEHARAGTRARLTFDSKPRGRTPMNKLTINGKTYSIAAFLADAIGQQAAAHKAAIDGGKIRRDALETGEVTIEGATLILPKAQIDQILAMLGGTPSGEPPATDPAADSDPTEDPQTPPSSAPARMDAASITALEDRIVAKVTAKLAKPIETAVTARLDALANRERICRTAAPLLGKIDTAGMDEWTVATTALVRVDSACRDEVERLAAAARRGDQRAAGRLEQRLEDAAAAATRTDSRTGGPSLTVVVDEALDNAAADKGKTRTDAVTPDPSEPDADAAYRRMVERTTKPKGDTASA